jgi:hypothetical protein
LAFSDLQICNYVIEYLQIYKVVDQSTKNFPPITEINLKIIQYGAQPLQNRNSNVSDNENEDEVEVRGDGGRGGTRNNCTGEQCEDADEETQEEEEGDYCDINPGYCPDKNDGNDDDNSGGDGGNEGGNNDREDGGDGEENESSNV